MSEKATYSREDLPAIKKLLNELCTRAEVEGLLRSVNAPFSAPRKEAVINTRVQQAIDEKRLDLAQAVALIQAAEEHGRQHVYLYRCSKARAAELLEEKHIREALKQISALSALDSPRVLDVPATSTITEVRREMFAKGQPKALVVKQVERREIHLPPDKRREGDEWVVRHKIVVTRGVNLIRLHADGWLEVRLQSEGRSPDYKSKRVALLKLLDPLFPDASFRAVSLEKVKAYMLEQREKLRTEYRLWWAKARNLQGDAAVFSTGATDVHLLERPGMQDSLAEFMKKGDALPASWVAYFSVGENEDGKPLELRVSISGEDHEFFITSECSAAQYEHVLAKLRQYHG